MRSNSAALGLTQVILGAVVLVLAVVAGSVAEIRGPALVVIGLMAVGVAITGLAAMWTARRRELGLEAPPTEPISLPPEPGERAALDQGSAVMLLSLLQEKGRLVDFVMEDIAAYTDRQVSAAARVVHQGCREVITASFDPAPVSDAEEKSRVKVPLEAVGGEFRIVGALGGAPPYEGKLVHKGWRARKVKLPRSTRQGGDVGSPVIVPAEVEI